MGMRASLKDGEGKTNKSLTLPVAQYTYKSRIPNIMFSSDNCAVFIYLEGMFQLWRIYVNDDDEDRLIILSKLPDVDTHTLSLSHDNTMVAIHEEYEDKGSLYSIDMDHRCLALKIDFSKMHRLFLHV